MLLWIPTLLLAAATVTVTDQQAGGYALRRTETVERVPDEKGMTALTVLDVWLPGQSRKGKPAHSFRVEGFDGAPLGDGLYVVARGTEDVEWWSVHRLRDGAEIYATHVRPIATGGGRFAGFEVPEDGDPRLKQDPLLFGIVVETGVEGPIRRDPLRARDAAHATRLRSYWDAQRKMSVTEGGRTVEIRISGGEPDATIRIPLTSGGLGRCCDIVSR